MPLLPAEDGYTAAASISMTVHSTKHCWTSSSKDFIASEAKIGGVTLVMWNMLQKLLHIPKRSTAATSTRPDSSFLDSAHLPVMSVEHNPQLGH